MFACAHNLVPRSVEIVQSKRVDLALGRPMRSEAGVRAVSFQTHSRTRLIQARRVAAGQFRAAG
jgi:hypothetical protein